MKADVIIQARLGSTRLANKVLLEILGKAVLEYVVERVRMAEGVKTVVVATSTKAEDSRIEELAVRLGVKSYRGSEEDVLDRFYQAARFYNLRHIVRITADCPLIDPRVIDDVVGHYFSTGADYCSNTLERTYPDGEEVRVFGFKTLEKTWREARLLSEREHVTPYMEKNPNIFKLANLKNSINTGDKRWSIDEKEDFEFIKIILENLYPKRRDFHMKDVLEFLRANPAAENINKHIIIDEGYIRSLKKDKVITLKQEG